MDYQEAIEYLGKFSDYEKTTGFSYGEAYFNLDRIKTLLSNLNNPQDSFRSIHIAGTKGKGSVAYFIANVLKYAGFKVGLYTSPHLVNFNERIQILHLNEDKLIGEDDVSRLTETIEPVIDALMKNTSFKAPTFFEVYTSLCFSYFAEEEVDFAIIETGLGGRLDATNVISPLVSILTPISLDHTKELGSTVKEIAKEKCGIIKDNVPCVSAPQVPEIIEIIRDTAGLKKSKLYIIEENINFEIINFNLNGGMFNCKTPWNTYNELSISVLGKHQIINAVVAVFALDVLNAYNEINVHKEAVYSGLKNTYLPGRLEIIGEKPLFLLDVAHNPFSAESLKAALNSLFKWNKLFFIIGMSTNKDIEGFCNILCGMADKVILTKAHFIRAADPDKIKEKILKFEGKIEVSETVSEAITRAFSLAKEDDLICVTGSFYVAGEAKYFLENIDNEK